MNEEKKTECGRFRPKNAYYHANAKGTGSAISFELHPAHDDVEGSIFVEIARQKSIGGFVNGAKTFATFDWDNKIVVRLDKTDLSQILQVFRGIEETVMDGKGLYHQTVGANTVIRFNHLIEPHPGYQMSISRKMRSASDPDLISFFFSPSEALELSCAIEGSMVYICFGMPMIVPRANREDKRMLELLAEPAAAAVKADDPF